MSNIESTPEATVTPGFLSHEEATRLLEYQRSYQAVSKMIGVLSDLTESVLNILH